MKCRSVACIWSGTPFPHKVTAVAALTEPPSPAFYTAGSDGSIIWWTLSHSNSNSNSNSTSTPQVKAVGMLCGHAAPITDLGICCPVAAEEENGYLSSKSNFSALISACCDGFLCVWSKSSGHCRCRRKLPPWVGTPRIIRTLHSTPRYVCIACSSFVDNSVNSIEENQGLMDTNETLSRKPPKCTILIVDTYSLSITQTVFHGNLSIGPIKFMSLVLADDDDDGKRHSVFVADSVGKQQMVPIPEDPRDCGESLTSSNMDKSQLESSLISEGLSGVEQIISVLTYGNFVAFILKNRCIFRLLSGDTKIGEVSFVDNLCCLDGHSTQAHVIGGMFLESDDVGNECGNLIPVHFVVWNNRGSAIIYKISYQNDVFQCEPHSEVPASHYEPDMRLSVFFLQVNQYLVCMKSVCFHYEEPLLWRPHVTIWSLHHFDDKPGKLYRQCKMISCGISFTNWFEKSTQLKGLDGLETKSTFGENPSSNDIDNIHVDSISNHYAYKGQMVSSSMIISENLFTPYAVVYGFLSGEIEVVRFDLFQGICLDGASSNPNEKSTTCKQYFSGHTGAVLCLAAHQMMGSGKSCSFKRVLLSGSTDCTIRIWDLDSGSLIMVMHHHVAAVRQIILPPSLTGHSWSDCFLSVGEDACVALVSLETLRVERMFPGHMNYPSKVVWDGARGYIACLCQMHYGTSDATDLLYIWDVKTGSRERVLRGTAAHSMFDHFCKSISLNSISGRLLNGNTSVSSLLLPIVDDARFSNSPLSLSENSLTSSRSSPSISNMMELDSSKTNAGKGNLAKPSSSSLFGLLSNKLPVKCSCPFPGVVSLSFDLASLMFSYQKNESMENGGGKPVNISSKQQGVQEQNPSIHNPESLEGQDWVSLFEEYLLRYSLSFLHLWGVDSELDNLLISDMKLRRPDNFIVASGLQGDKGSMTLTFPDLSATLELWKSSSEFCAMRSLTMVSLAQRLISLSHSGSAASSALAAFYTRNFMESFPDMKPPSLQLLVAFWQDESEHVRMAARSIFHCAASHAIPLPLCNSKPIEPTNTIQTGSRDKHLRDTAVESISPMAEKQGISQDEESRILAWLESFEVQDWISCVGGTSQDAMTSHIIVAAALAIWYPSLVKPSLATLVVHPLMKLAMAMNEKYSSTAAELLAEGMESTWKKCIVSEIPHLIGDIFFQVELSGPSSKSMTEISASSFSIKQTLVEVLLPSLAMADIPGFLTVIESQIWSTASDSPIHMVSLLTLIRIMRGSPRNLAQYLDKVVNFILQTIDPSNSVMRKACFQSSMTTFKEVVRVYPMVAVNESWTRLAVGDVIGEINNASIRVYDMQSVTMIKVLDASGPPGLPSLLTAAASGTMLTTAISALSFSPNGEGLVAFSEHGLMIRWWSLGSFWWEKLSRNFVPVQCTKLIFVPPWEGFSPNTSRSSIMANIFENDRQLNFQDNGMDSNNGDSLKQLLHNLDLSYRLEWVGERKVLLTRHGHELGTFQL